MKIPMAELRKDYFFDRWVIIAPGRSKRPFETGSAKRAKSKACFFCPGSESMTPGEIGRAGAGRRWKMRWFPNKYSVVERAGSPDLKTRDPLRVRADAYGDHEIIVETPEHGKQLWDLKAGDAALLLEICSERIEALEKTKGARYVQAFKNHGSSGGASLQHSHSQIVSLSMLPPGVKEELAAYARGKCGHCRIIKSESKSKRKCFEDGRAVAFAPYASRFSYELWILPRRHVRRLSELRKSELRSLASILMKALRKLRKIDAPYNYVLRYSPSGFDSHLKIEVTPRMARWAGLEIGSGITVNSVSPEAAASFYRSRA